MTTNSLNLIPDQPGTIAPGGKRRWLFPAEIRGRWQNLRKLTSLVLLTLLYATPWLSINGAPFLRLSFLSSSFVMFGSPILMHDFHHFVLLALLLIVTLFAASAIIGRVWCGFACPQTIFIEQILGRIDRLIEGPAAKRQLDSKRPWTFERVIRRAAKLLAYGIVSFSFAFTLVAIFTGPEAILMMDQNKINAALLVLTLLAWFDAAYWREQFCHIVCPYARFQGVMQDQATRSIGYDMDRGEPRSPLKRKSITPEKKGDCIDCGLCVRVCPSGIDIRQGATQQECIACARCIDACDGIMKNLGRPTGLIRYDALAKFEQGAKALPPPILRPRVVVYAIVWILLLAVGLAQYLNRHSFHAQILSTSGTKPYFVDQESVKNLMSLKIGNQSPRPDRFTVSIKSADNGIQPRIESPTMIGPVLPGQELTAPLLISVQSLTTKTLNESIIIRSENTGEERIIERKFVFPGG